MRRSRAEIYRAKAETCRQQATLPQNAAQRDRWLKLAEQWSALADNAKKERKRMRKAKRKTMSSVVHIQAVR